MSECPGVQRASKAAEPDWFAQANEQMGDLFLTLDEINDETVMEAWDALEDALIRAKRLRLVESTD